MNEDSIFPDSPSFDPALDTSLDGLRTRLDALQKQYLLQPREAHPLALGQQLSFVIGTIRRTYVRLAGDTPGNQRAALKRAFEFVKDVFPYSDSKIRLYVHAYEKFHRNDDAVMYLRMTDMQLLLSHEIGDDIVATVIQRRKDNPALSTREVKDLINEMRTRSSAEQDKCGSTDGSDSD